MLINAASSTIFESLVWFDLGLNPGLPDHWATLYSLGQWSTFTIYTPLMMAQDRAKSSRESINYGRFINEFPPDTIKSMRWLERTNTKRSKQRISILCNQIYIYIYIYIRFFFFKKKTKPVTLCSQLNGFFLSWWNYIYIYIYI